MTLLSKAKHLLTGEKAEQNACQYLLKQNLKLISKNYRSKFGEIDIIMQDGQTLVFVEVRYRKQDKFGSGAESITLTKQKKLIKTASFYLQQHSYTNALSARFDVVSMSAQPASTNMKIDWIKDAFQA
jgi:putative endonuclease